MSEFKSPVYNIIAVPVEKIRANEYNPNHVAPPEMKLLYDSIKEDGYTMPIVCYYNADEVIRLKQMSGLASLFRNEEFSNSWDIE
jgi:hypothetical protein